MAGAGARFPTPHCRRSSHAAAGKNLLRSGRVVAMSDARGAGSAGTDDVLVAALREALASGGREPFTRLLSHDVHWGGEHGGNECSSRVEAGDQYEGLVAAGVTMHILEATRDGDALLVRLSVGSPDPGELPPGLTVRLTLRDGLVADVRELDPPPTIELLYVDRCPHHETFLPHLRKLLDEHGIIAPVTLVRIDSHDDARARRFLGSPTLRVNGHDVDPASGGDVEDAYALQCRLYSTPTGIAGAPPDQWILDALVANPTHEAAIAAVRAGDLPALGELLREHPHLATARLARREGRTLLHIATDWPGHYPDVAAIIAALVAAGADPNASGLGDHPETPLHWAASSNDLCAVNALLDAGADIDAPGAVIGGGTPMADATAFGQWPAVRLLLERGAATNLFESAALGLVDRVRAHLATADQTPENVTSGLWGACHGGQLETAHVLLEAGADVDWVGYDGLTPLDAAHRAEATDIIEWLRGHVDVTTVAHE